MLIVSDTYELHHDKSNQIACAPSKDSDQPGHPPSLIRVFAVRMKKAWVLSYPLSASEEYDPSLRWGHKSVCWFCHVVAHVLKDLMILCTTVLPLFILNFTNSSEALFKYF